MMQQFGERYAWLILSFCKIKFSARLNSESGVLQKATLLNGIAAIESIITIRKLFSAR